MKVSLKKSYCLKEKSTPTDQNLGMILKTFKVWYLKDFKGKLVLIVHRLVTQRVLCRSTI
jgi:hypothetical protein